MRVRSKVIIYSTWLRSLRLPDPNANRPNRKPLSASADPGRGRRTDGRTGDDLHRIFESSCVASAAPFARSLLRLRLLCPPNSVMNQFVIEIISRLELVLLHLLPAPAA